MIVALWWKDAGDKAIPDLIHPVKAEDNQTSDVTIQWGDVPEWLASIGTVGALWATYTVIRRDHRRQEEQHEEQLYDQALLITGRIRYVMAQGPPPDHEPRNDVRTTITNDGRRPVRDVRATLWAPRGGPALSNRSANVLPAQAELTWDDRPRKDLMTATGYDAVWSVEFTDVAGRRWRKTSAGYLVPLGSPNDESHSWRRVRARRLHPGQEGKA